MPTQVLRRTARAARRPCMHKLHLLARAQALRRPELRATHGTRTSARAPHTAHPRVGPHAHVLPLAPFPVPISLTVTALPVSPRRIARSAFNDTKTARRCARASRLLSASRLGYVRRGSLPARRPRSGRSAAHPRCWLRAYSASPWPRSACTGRPDGRQPRPAWRGPSAHHVV
jgi:hypothetical protein